MSCSVPNCDSSVKGYRGFCNKHYLRFLRHGDPLGFTPRKKKGICTIPECGRPNWAKQQCRFHYNDDYKQNAVVKERFCSTHKGRYGSGKRSAKVRSLPWLITLEEYIKIIECAECYYGCGNKLPPKGLGLDRLDSSLGYTVSNVVPCCASCNVSRLRNFTPEEWKVMIAALVKFRNKE